MSIDEFEEQVKGAVPDPWDGQIFSLKDAYAPREPLSYVIDGLFPKGSLSIVYGPPGSLKSMLLGDVATAVAAGQSWLGRGVTQGPAFWLDFDNGKRRTHERFEALARARRLSESVPFYYVSMPTPWLNAGKVADIEALEKRIKSLGATLVVIDNLGLISPSSAENSDEMIVVMSHLRLLAERTGAAIVLIHHQRKSNGIQSRAGESIRGHSSIESSVDLALRVDREPDTDFVTIQSTKVRDCVVPLFGCEFRYEHKIDTTQLMEAYFFKTEFEDTTSIRAIENGIISTVETQPGITQGNLVSAVNEHFSTPKHSIRKLISSLVKRHRIKAKIGARGAMHYSVE